MERVLVVGCGGIGGVVAAGLAPREEVALTALSSNVEIARAVNARGFVVRDRDGTRAVPGAVVTSAVGRGPFDFVLLATQPNDVEEAARSVLEELAPDGAFVVLQNGLCEPRIARVAGDDRVLGGIVMWGASMERPGEYTRTSSGGFVLGRMDGVDDPRLARLARLLAPIGPARTTADLAGARWSKLAFNCAISTLGTIGGDEVGALMRYGWVRRLVLEVFTEVVEVAAAEGVRPARLAGALDLEWIALTEAERLGLARPSLVVKHAVLLAVGARYRRLRSSMLRAIERGRPPAVDFLNGEIVEAARRRSVRVPINEAARDAVHAIAAGRLRSSHATLRALYEATRAAAPSRRSA